MSELVTVYELEKRADGSIGIGNSIELPRAEAILQIQQGSVKHESAPIGELPTVLLGGGVVAEAEDHGGNFTGKRSRGA